MVVWDLLFPDLLDLVNLVLAEFHPGLNLLSLLDGLLISLIIKVTVLIVKLHLNDGFELERNLGNLAHVHARALSP